MKKALITILAISLFMSNLGLLGVSADSQNLIQNGDFETLRSETTYFNVWGDINGDTDEVCTTDPYSGEKCLRLNKSASGYFAAGQIISSGFEPGDVLEFRGMYKRVGIASNNKVRIAFQKPNGSSFTDVSHSDNNLGVSELGVWEEKVYRVVVPDETTRINISLIAMTDGSAAVDDYWDDVTLTKVDAITAQEGVEYIDNGGMEVVTSALPDGYVFEGTAGEEHSVDITTVESGTKSWKMTNAEDDSISFTKVFTVPACTYELSAYFNLTEIGEGAEGVKFSVFNANTGEEIAAQSSGYFTATDKGYRKFLTSAKVQGESYLGIRVTLNGQGTVYIDDISVKVNNGIINGDFEGLKAEGVPAAWTATSNVSNPWTESGDVVLVEDNGNNYVRLNSLAVGQGIQQTLGGEFINGIDYKVTVNYQELGSYDRYARPYFNMSSADAGRLTYLILKAPTGVNIWTTSELYRVHSQGLTWKIALMTSGGSGTTRQWCYDNITMEAITDKVEFFSDDTKLETLSATGDIDVKYTHVPTVYPTPTSVTMMVALFEKNASVKTLKDIEVSEGTPVAEFWNTSGGEQSSQGHIPLEMTDTINVPVASEGPQPDYVIEVFSWNGINTMEPYGDKAVLD